MYPTVVIVLVETQRSMTDICEIDPSNASKSAGPVASEVRPASLGPLSFAVGPVYSTTDNEAESQSSRTLQSQSRQKCGPEEVITELNSEREAGTLVD